MAKFDGNEKGLEFFNRCKQECFEKESVELVDTATVKFPEISVE